MDIVDAIVVLVGIALIILAIYFDSQNSKREDVPEPKEDDYIMVHDRERDKYVHCPYCGATFNDPDELNAHFLNKHNR